MMGRLSGGLAGEKSPGKSRIEKLRATPDGTRQATHDTRHPTGDTRHATPDWRNVTGGAKMASPTNKRKGMQMSTTLRITYEVVVPDEWGDPHEFGTTTAMELADVIEGALFDHVAQPSVKWVGSEQREGK
jgi:hypothetical protein